MFRFEGLEIWKLAFAYADEVYRLTEEFPDSERFALTDQLRRASLSMSTNIAEGSAGTPREFSQYVSIAIRSALETVSLLRFAFQRGYIDESESAEFYEKAERFVRKAHSFKNSLQAPSSSDSRLALSDKPTVPVV